MPEFKLNDDGQLVDAEGKVFAIDEEEVKVVGGQTQAQVDAVIKKRLARQDEQIKALQSQADKTPELQKVLDDLKREKEQMEIDLERAQTTAQEEVATQLKTANEQADTAKRELVAERQARIKDQTENLILANAGDMFINPALDVVPMLQATHKREPKTGEDGKVIKGEFHDLFEVEVFDKDESKREYLPIKDALAAVAVNSDFQHYVKGSQTGGSGGGAYAVGAGRIKKRSDLQTKKEKADFVHEHGVDAYKQLED